MAVPPHYLPRLLIYLCWYACTAIEKLPWGLVAYRTELLAIITSSHYAIFRNHPLLYYIVSLGLNQLRSLERTRAMCVDLKKKIIAG